MNKSQLLELTQNWNSEKNELVLRPGTTDDRAAVGELFKESWLELSLRLGFLEKDSDIEYPVLMIDATWVVTAGDHVVGFLLQADSHVSKIYVLPGLQGLGVGSLLLEKAMENGARTLFVDESNTVARRFYESHGWAPTGKSEKGLVFPSPILEYGYEDSSVK